MILHNRVIGMWVNRVGPRMPVPEGGFPLRQHSVQLRREKNGFSWLLSDTERALSCRMLGYIAVQYFARDDFDHDQHSTVRRKFAVTTAAKS